MANTIGTAYINIAPNMQGIQGKIAGGLKGSGSTFADQFGGEISGKSAVIIGAIAGVAQSAVTKAMGLVTNSIGAAVARVDTLNAAQKTFQYMGFAADDAAAATKAVTASILGLPTPLDSAVRGMTSLAATYQDVKLGQKVFSALNDAILGFGGTTDMVSGAIQQLSQLPLDGPLDAQTWNSLRNSGLTPVLVAIGKDMGKSIGQLKTEFGDGTLKVQDFVNELLKLDTQGGGGLENLHKIALTATSGISTGFANMQTAISRGLATIIQSIGQQNISGAITAVGNAFEVGLKGVSKFFNFLDSKGALMPALGATLAVIGAAFVAVFVPLLATVGAAVAAAAPFIAIAAGIGAAAALIYQNWSKVTALFSLLFKGDFLGSKSFFGIQEDSPIVRTLLTVHKLLKLVVDFVGSQLKSAFESIASIGKQLGDNLKPVTDAIKSILANKTVQTVLKGIGIALLAIAAAPIVAFFATMIASLTIISKVLGFVADHFKIFKIVALTALAPILVPIALLVGAIKLIPIVVRAASSAISTAFSVVGTVFSAIAAIYNATLGPVFSTMINIVQTIFGIYVKVWAAIALVVVGTLFIIGSIIANVMQTIWGVISSVWNAIYGVISTVVGFITGIIVNAWNFYFGIISSVLGAIWGVITAVWNAVAGFIGGVLATIGGIVAGAWNAVYSTISGVVGSIWGVVTNAFNNVISFLGGIGGRIVAVFAGAGRWLYDVGKNIIQGLLDGAESLLSKVGQFFLDKLPGWIQGPFKKALGIHSPSTVFHGFGQDSGQGYINGVTAMAKPVMTAVSGMANAAISGMAQASVTPVAMANVTPGSEYSTLGVGGAPASGKGATVIQNNTVNNNVDFQKVVNDMTWELNRIG